MKDTKLVRTAKGGIITLPTAVPTKKLERTTKGGKINLPTDLHVTREKNFAEVRAKAAGAGNPNRARPRSKVKVAVDGVAKFAKKVEKKQDDWKIKWNGPKSIVGTPTKRFEYMQPMDQAKTSKTLNNTKISKRTYDVENQLSQEIKEASERYKNIPDLLFSALRFGDEKDYLRATVEITNLFAEDNERIVATDKHSHAGEYKDSYVKGAFAEAVLIRVLFELRDSDLKSISTLLRSNAQQFVNSIPRAEAEDAFLERSDFEEADMAHAEGSEVAHRDGKELAYHRAQAMAGTAINILIGAVDKRWEKITVEGPKRAQQVDFNADAGTFRYKPQVPAAQAIVDMQTSLNAQELAGATRQLGDGLDWLMEVTASKGKKAVEHQLKSMAAVELRAIATVDVEDVVEQLRNWRRTVPGKNGEPDYVKPPYDKEQLGAMQDVLTFIKNRAAERLARA